MTGKFELGDVTLSSITAYRGIHQREAFDTDGSTSSSFEVRRGDLDEREYSPGGLCRRKQAWNAARRLGCRSLLFP